MMFLLFTLRSFSNVISSKILKHFFKGEVQENPKVLYVGLYLSGNQPDSNGAGGTEVSLYGYSRQLLELSDSVNGVAYNTNTLTFTNTGGGAWGAIEYWAVWDSSTGGNLIQLAGTGGPPTVNAGQTFTISPGDLGVTFGTL